MNFFKDEIIDDIFNAYLTVKFELIKHLRRKRLFITLFLATLIPLLFYIVPKAFNTDFPETAAEFASSNLGFINLLVIISAAIFGGDAISGEYEKKTGLLLFPTPQRRTSIFIGKFIAALIAIYFIVSLYYFITLLEIAQVYGFGDISIDFVKSYFLALLFASSVLGIIYLFSSIMKGTMPSTLLGFFFLLMILPIISVILMVADIEPWFMITYSGGLITNVLGVESDVDPHDEEMNFSKFTPDLYTGIAVMFAYTIILVLFSIIIANRRTME